MILALFFTVALLVATAYCIFGSIPLLVLKHDTPLDSRFVRSFFDKYYLAAAAISGATSLSYAYIGRAALAVGAAALVLLAVLLRKSIITQMDAISLQIEPNNGQAISRFRKIHIAAIAINVAQLVLILWSLSALG